MTNVIRTFIFGLLIFLGACQNKPKFTVMTYNIRLDIAVDGNNAWSHRKDLLVSQLQEYTPDIFGVQEALPGQMDFINQGMPNHDFIGHGRDGGHVGEYSAIFYDRTKFQASQEHTFWLSETPREKSMGWDAAYPRICTYGLFTHLKTGKKIWVFNTHLDHMGEQARQNGMALILDKISTVNTQNYPVLLMGDFNAEPDDKLMADLREHMFDVMDISISAPVGPGATFNAFEPNLPATRRIDYIMLSPKSGLTVNSYHVLRDNNLAQFPSDHFPVFVVLGFK